jgi:hypothetical protein
MGKYWMIAVLHTASLVLTFIYLEMPQI